VVLAALALRVGYVLGWKNPAPILGDAFYYHYGANLFADGHGFPDPYAWKLTGRSSRRPCTRRSTSSCSGSARSSGCAATSTTS